MVADIGDHAVGRLENYASDEAVFGGFCDLVG
jgi:hypothetical protein